MPKDSVDINVSPDKKTIYLHSEANLIQSLVVSPAMMGFTDAKEPSSCGMLIREVSCDVFRTAFAERP